jgi:gp16 family phage-associated protein
MKQLKSPEQARADFDYKGLSIAAWARANGFSRSLVYEVMAGRKKCNRGQSHKIAVMLGMKRGVIVNNAAG